MERSWVQERTGTEARSTAPAVDLLQNHRDLPMLSPTENDVMCRVNAGTPMGNVLRTFWMPALLSRELPEPDCAPVRVGLLGEDLVAFRDSTGQVGLVAENCPHRGASLFFGRNEEEGFGACITAGSSTHRA